MNPDKVGSILAKGGLGYIPRIASRSSPKHPMLFFAKKLLAALILPPSGPALFALAGLWVARAQTRRWRSGGLALAALSLLALVALSVPAVGNALLAPLERHPAATLDAMREAQAIVVLGGGSYHAAPEYSGDTVSAATLERLRYAARLARATGLPLLVTGGAPFGGTPEGATMKIVLEQEFGVAVRWAETASRDTAENARNSAAMLSAAGVTHVALVSHAWHLTRAMLLFERTGLTVVPAPTAFATASPSALERWLPGDLRKARTALNEYLGIALYSLFPPKG